MVRILSYNIFYKAMLLPDDKMFNITCNPIIYDKKYKIKYSTCLKNVSDFIESNGPYDFVGLQEATNWKIIQKITPKLQKMAPISYKEDLDEIVTFYDQDKYQLDIDQYLFQGHMIDKNRPFIILFFKQRICVINLHAGHYSYRSHTNDIYNLDYYLKRSLIENKFSKIYLKKLKTYDIIMMGDFNDSLKNNSQFNVLGRSLYGINKKETCCSNNLAPRKHHKALDHILSTCQNIKTVVLPNDFASDHLPIISNLSKNIGYDFDGVLHLSVTKADESGQRHPISLYGPYQIFNKIVDQIERDIIDGHKIYIITARSNTKFSYNAIKNHLVRTKLHPYIEQIDILFAAGQSKTGLLKKYVINTFYDDSCLRIIELYNAKKNNELPFLTQMFFVNPDDCSIILVNSHVMQIYCSKYLTCRLNPDISSFSSGNFHKNPQINILLEELKNRITLNNISVRECKILQNEIIRLINNEKKNKLS